MSSRPAIRNKFPEKPKPYFNCHALDNLGVGISSLVTDSRMVKPGDTFLAYAGEKADARKFIPQAIAAGANAVLWDPAGFLWDPAWKTPNLPVPELRARAGIIADHIYGHPSRKLWLVGITGTNGKTSCSHWIAQAMTALDRKTAVIGTLGMGFPGELELTANTTPDAVLLHGKMADFLRRGAHCVAMEVSSHGIVQERINGAAFAVAMVTNLSRDHLDYHGSMEAYAAAKARLFHWPGLKYAVLNLDDAFGVSLLNDLEGTETQIIGYGFTEPPAQFPDDKFKMLRGRSLRASPQGLEFDVEFEAEHLEFKTDVVGRFNASNLLGVLATLLASGITLADSVRALRVAQPVAGRMQQIGGGEQPFVVVDYAHTPDAMTKVLNTLREILHADPRGDTEAETRSRRLICVFGCGGERDRGKRRLMGEVATQLADEVIITSDNPRTENPDVIISEIVAGARADYHIERDRAAAIQQAIRGARKGDIVLIAGRGHEAYQEIDGKKLPFSDTDVARGILMDTAPLQA
ncbi:UDP-N-acetylmuramoyl-L-alanyl-D-glutamate--2,6-diaminopimelate ligase [Nitrosovibrio sp. Nv6]|uniref:UDP-N-acetylmuramoyl-L-alanyl-D-glutamate--2, 6-diaminopimelate ligase n=1 Tax=Nitrosovibrio sp. Nv6 TaxID=1855340 RepID=UPI0008D8D366|nr:UDP-N-acetylmuramoyl-L-alanyl-D-glutamate--2,6-diaminopimelate ligase [Nitrosovibrio sp. Nv6]SEP26240.1 UDP-N-acetylmuramoyl-L-alanyl-D-glutamate--2,6-diaminopimelate ligase [Nitrosovibrio sp. Nv6]